MIDFLNQFFSFLAKVFPGWFGKPPSPPPEAPLPPRPRRLYQDPFSEGLYQTGDP